MSWPKSKSEARRLYKQGAVRVDGVKLSPESTRGFFLIFERPFILQCGKRTFAVVTPDGWQGDGRKEAESYMHKDMPQCRCWACELSQRGE